MWYGMVWLEHFLSHHQLCMYVYMYNICVNGGWDIVPSIYQLDYFCMYLWNTVWICICLSVVCIHVCMYVCMYACIFVFEVIGLCLLFHPLCVYVFVCTCACICMCVHVYFLYFFSAFSDICLFVLIWIQSVAYFVWSLCAIVCLFFCSDYLNFGLCNSE